MELRNAEREASGLLSQHQRAANEATKLNNRIERARARMAALEEGPGSIEEHRAEIDRLKTLERNYKNALENLTKENAALKKQQEKQQAKVVKLKAQVDAKVKERNKLQAGLDSTKPLDELKEEVDEMEKQNEKDRRWLDENPSSSERQAVEDRVADREDKLTRLRTQVQEREEALPLRERIKNILKKYGWTLQAVVLAAGITISAVVLATLNGLKAATKAIGNGLKTSANRPPTPCPASSPLDRELHLQSCRAGPLLSCRTRLAAHPCRGGLPG